MRKVSRTQPSDNEAANNWSGNGEGKEAVETSMVFCGLLADTDEGGRVGIYIYI